MARRRFEHLVVELSVAAGQVVPRYPLWLRLGELGGDPDHLSRQAAVEFCDRHLDEFLIEHSLCVSARARRQLRRCVGRFDARSRSPEEWMQRLGAAAE